MRCPQCGSPDLMTSREDYRYTESGLDNVILKGVTVHHCQQCGEQFPVISQVKKVHERIARALLAKTSVLTGEEFRFLRKEMRLKASALANLMGVHKVTVSRWESNTESIGAPADRLLRYIYATRNMESLAECHNPLTWAMVSNTIQCQTRWLETQLKLIERTPIRHELVTLDMAIEELNKAAPWGFSLTSPCGCFVTSGNSVNLCEGSPRFIQYQFIFQPDSSPTKGTINVITQPREVVLHGRS
jgi:putative zinc finger/helix-turn-helix YgiT family protein